MNYYFPRIGWFQLSDEVAADIARETGLDERRNLHGWGVRWLSWDVMFAVKETDWNEEFAGDIRTAQAFWEAVREAAVPKPEPEVSRKRPVPRKKKTKSGDA